MTISTLNVKFCLITYFIKKQYYKYCILQVEGSFVTQNFTQTVIPITFSVRTRRDENEQEFWTFWQVHSNPIQSLHRTSLESSSVSIWKLISSCRQVSTVTIICRNELSSMMSSKAWLATYFELPHPQLHNPKSLSQLASATAPLLNFNFDFYSIIY